MKKLREDEFIHEGVAKDPKPLLYFFLGLVVVGIVAASFQYWRKTAEKQRFDNAPFLQVTNREISRFLWQNPEFLRNNVRRRSGYLPAWDGGERIGIKQGSADVYAKAPPAMLFRYHTWERLLGDVWIPRAIAAEEFRKFLQSQPDWFSEQWESAPSTYVEFLKELDSKEIDISDRLPLIVKQAFQGWKNFFVEGNHINSMQVTAGDVRALLRSYPQYAPSLWANLYPGYLRSLETASDSDSVPLSETPAFLRVALFNFRAAG